MSNCKVDKCPHKVVAKGYCDKHRKRIARRGTPFQEVKKGDSTKHPLYESWCRLRRFQPYEKSWEDFWVFVSDVIERPLGCSLFRIDNQLPYGKTNFFWKKGGVKTHATKKDIVSNCLPKRRRDLKRKYNLTLAEYDQLSESQKGVCKLCQKVDATYKYLTVDHCHKTGKVRGLLCHLCNKGLGHFKDCPQLLEKALAYLMFNNQTS